MAITLLAEAEVARLKAQELTYPAVDRKVVNPPPGYSLLARTRRLADTADFAVAGQALMSWQVQARSGLRVWTSSRRVEPGEVVVLRLGLGAAAVRIPCRVVGVVDEPDRQGFSYGSLPGHPVSGEESFLLVRGADGVLTFTVSAVSRPASPLARLGGPLSGWVQRWMTTRYLRALG